MTERTRAGFVGLAGRPNAGKSTLVNAIVGAHVAIVSERPQTTRRAIRGVATDTDAGWQLVLVDLPGVQRPRDALTERMQRRVEREIADSDVVLFVVNGEEGVGPGDRFISKALLGGERATPRSSAPSTRSTASTTPRPPPSSPRRPSSTASTRSSRSAPRPATDSSPWSPAWPSSSPRGRSMYPPEQRSDQPSEVLLAELIREQVLRRTREELPHAVEVEVDEVAERDDGLTEVEAQIWAETESQKGILIGAGGTKIKEIGSGARTELERELGSKVFLDLKVRVRGQLAPRRGPARPARDRVAESAPSGARAGRFVHLARWSFRPKETPRRCASTSAAWSRA